MQLTILNVAYPFAAVGANSVGGAEQVLAHLDAALVRAGHKSIVIACEGSQAKGVLVASEKCDGALTDELCQRVRHNLKKIIEDTLKRWSVDLVHLHGVDFSEYLPETTLPILVTLHLPLSFYPKNIFANGLPNLFFHCVSKSQARACPPETRLLPEIENGVSLGSFSGNFSKRSFSMSLGRICPEKGFHFALDAARRARVPFYLGGEVFEYEAHQKYFQSEIVPRLDEQRRFIGPIGLARKRRLLSGARCVLIPSLVAETSSLVAMESLACGTPVIAFPNGALPEIIEHGKTGFLVNDEREMTAAIRCAKFIDSKTCRETARQRFSHERMIQNYFALYHRLAHSEHDSSSENVKEETDCVG